MSIQNSPPTVETNECSELTYILVENQIFLGELREPKDMKCQLAMPNSLQDIDFPFVMVILLISD